MASEVKFNIRLLVDGKEKIVEATTDVSKLADEFEKAKNSSTKLRDKLLEFNQASQAFQNMAAGIQQLLPLPWENTHPQPLPKGGGNRAARSEQGAAGSEEPPRSSEEQRKRFRELVRGKREEG